MKKTPGMIYKEVLEKRLARKIKALSELETGGIVTPDDKRKFIEHKAVITELENVLDIADTLFLPGEDHLK